MRPDIASIIGIILALIGTIVLYVLIMPKKKDGELSPFLQFLHNYFHFKQLYVEVAMKFLFMLVTLFTIFAGFFMLFGRNFLTGLLLMIVGPIAVRLTYEMLMMFILLIQNVIDINKKLGPSKNEAVGKGPQMNPMAYQPQVPNQAQAQAPIGKPCPNCGFQCKPDASFCPNCGQRM